MSLVLHPDAFNQPPAAPRKRRGKVILLSLLGLVLFLVLAVGILILAAPSIASSMAPGKIEAAARDKIAGSVRVQGISLGWGSPTKVGPIEILDPSGNVAARVEVNTPTTLWTIVKERWWSADDLDLGELTVAGMADLIREPDGSTNLERALKPKDAAGKSTSGSTSSSSGSSGPSRVRAVVKLDQIDMTVRDRPAVGAQPGSPIGVKKLRGTVNLDAGLHAPMNILAKADLTGDPVGAEPGAQPVKLKADASIKQKSGKTGFLPGDLEKGSIKLDVTSAPISLVDAVAAMGGALVQGVGPKADISVDAGLTSTDMRLKLNMVSDGVNADLDLEQRDGAITSAGPAAGSSASNVVSVRSTEFLASLPQLRPAFEKSAGQLKLSSYPKLDIVVESLRWPLPVTGGNAGGAAAATDLSKQDLRGYGLVVRAKVGAIAGQVNLAPAATPATPAAAGQPATPAAPAAAPDWRPFTIDPGELVIDARDLSKPVTISGGTRASLSNQPAGELTIRATAAGLLTPTGTLRALAQNAGMAENIDADISLRGLSTALAQPFLATSGLPVDLATDVGPTLDFSIRAKADVNAIGQNAGAQAAANQPAVQALPPIDAVLSVTSNNVRAQGAARLDKNILTLGQQGLNVQMNATTPLVSRLLTKPGQPAPVILGGTGAVTLTAQSLRADLDKLKGAAPLSGLTGNLVVNIANLTAALPVSAPVAGAPAPAPVQPITISALNLTTALAPGQAPKLDLTGDMSHEGRPFKLTSNLTLTGLTSGAQPDTSKGPIQTLINVAPSGEIRLADVPRSLANLASGASQFGTGAITGTDLSSQITIAIREVIGQSLTAVVALAPENGAQQARVQLSSSSGGLGANVNTRLAPTQITVSNVGAFVLASPQIVNPVLAQSMQKSGQAAPGQRPMSLGGPVKLTVTSPDTITIPLKPGPGGSVAPDFANAPSVNLVLATDADLIVQDLPIGAAASGAAAAGLTGVRLQGLKGQASYPLASLAGPEAAKSKRLSASASMNLAKVDSSRIAEVVANLAAGLDASAPEAALKVTNLDVASLDQALAQGGKLTGALGNTAQADVRVTQSGSGAAQTTNIAAEITAPRLSQAKLALVQDQTRMALTQPATITWSPDAVFLQSLLVPAPAPGAAPRAANSTPRITQVTPITIKINALALATSGPAAANQAGQSNQAATGPLKPGVFQLDLSANMPSLSMVVPPSDPASGAQPITLGVEGLNISAKQEGNELLADVIIDKVSGAGSTAQQKSQARARIANLANQNGVVTIDRAITNLNVDFAAFPTALVDALANQHGLLAELLGPAVTLNVVGQGVTLGTPGAQANAAQPNGGPQANAAASAGTIKATLTSPRARAGLEGRLENGAFVQTGGITISLNEIRPELIKVLGGSLPVVDSVEKTPKDQPATIDASSLRLPIDGDLTKLSGQVRIDPGILRFTTQPIFGELITALGGKTAGEIGKRMEPFVINMNRGVLTYDRFTLPIGQINMSTRGTVDLVRRNIDVVTYVPLSALSGKALGQLNTGGIAGKLGLIDQNTGVPITTRGSLDSPKTELDVGLFFKETGDKLLSDPGKLIEKGLGDLLKPKSPPPSNPATPAAPKKP